MAKKLTSILQKTVDEIGLSYPVATFEELCKMCLETGPIGTSISSDRIVKLTYKITPLVKKICSSDGGVYAIFGLLEMLDDSRWGYILGDACYENKITADQLIACLQRGVASAMQSVYLFCSKLKPSYGPLFASAFIGTLTGSKSWDTIGLQIALLVLEEKDKEVLPHLAVYKYKIDTAEMDSTGDARKNFAALSIMVRYGDLKN